MYHLGSKIREIDLANNVVEDLEGQNGLAQRHDMKVRKLSALHDEQKGDGTAQT